MLTDEELSNEPMKARHSSPFGFRSVSTQVLLVSCTAFCTIGSFNALQGLGGAGQEKPYVANAATAINFGLMGIVCMFGGPIVTLLGVKWTLALGTCGDPLFGAAVYCNTKYGIQWFLIFAAVFRGLFSGLFWATEGAIIIGYPRDEWRGRSITCWVAFKEMGSIVSSSINLGLSAHDNKAGSVGFEVYYVTLAIMCLALPIALLLSPTHRVVHSNGDHVHLEHSGTYRLEYRRLGKLICQPDVLLIIPFAWFAYFYYSFAHTFVNKSFSVRGRALTSLLTAIASVIGSSVIAVLADRKRSRSTSRLMLLTMTVFGLCIATWIYFAVTVLDYTGPRLDWSDDGFARRAMSVVLLFVAMQAAQTYLYWTASFLTDTVGDAFHLAGLVRGVESLGQCVAYGVNSSATSPVVSIALNLAFFLIGSVCLLILLVRRSGQVKC